MSRNSILLILFAVVVLSVIWLRSLHDAGREFTACAQQPPARPTRRGEFRGFSLQLHSGDKNIPYKDFIDQIARTSANTVCLVVHGYQENVSSRKIFIDARKTPDDSRLAGLIDHAHDKGLQVMIMPVVLLAERHGSDWRGKIKPDDWDKWWKEYNSFILRYAAAAQAGEAEIFSVGSELISTETQTKRWRGLIAAVRSVYQGRLVYSANWDHYQAPQFWADLDIIGMTSYFTLTKDKPPDLREMLSTWAGIKRDILKWRETVNRPILFTEVGWPNQVTAARYPWNYYASVNQPDPAQQANCFESFFRTWADEQDVAGFLVWEWPNQPGQVTSPEKDTSYCPVGKPAMKIIQSFFKKFKKFEKIQKSSPSPPITASGAPATAPAGRTGQ